MQRWWHGDEKDKPLITSRSPTKLKKNLRGDRKWKFQVLVNKNLYKEEKLAITGNCEALGNWQPHEVVILNQVESKLNRFIKNNNIRNMYRRIWKTLKTGQFN